MKNDLTVGSPAKAIFFFAIPFLIGNVFQQFYNIADTVIVGRTLGVNALSAVGSTGGLVFLIVGFAMGVSIGFSMLTAQYYGAKNIKGIKKSFAQSILLSVIFISVLTIISLVFLRKLLILLNTPDEIMESAYRYLFIIFAGMMATQFYNLLANMIRSVGNSRIPLYFLIVASFINIVLDLFFITKLGMGVEGAGYATVISQFISGLLCVIYIIRKIPEFHFSLKDLKPDLGIIKKLIHLGLPMGFLNSVLAIGGITVLYSVNGLSNTLGTDVVAAYSAATKIDQLNNQPIQSFGSAVAVFSAQNFGAGYFSRIKQGVRSGLGMTFIWMGISLASMFFFGRFFMSLVVSGTETAIIDYGRQYLLCNTGLSFLLIPVVLYKGCLQAIGRTVIPTASGIVEIFGRMFAALILTNIIGFTGLCLANPCAWLCAVIPLGIEYYIVVNRLIKREKQIA